MLTVPAHANNCVHGIAFLDRLLVLRAVAVFCDGHGCSAPLKFRPYGATAIRLSTVAFEFVVVSECAICYESIPLPSLAVISSAACLQHSMRGGENLF